ncbi:MAG TPA: hypothetical protein VK149_10760 [Sideroxyarcus sp.]|nr:hypothetical protein [Sideroxyarcus sp.]
MKHAHLLLIVLTAALATGCASRQASTGTAEAAAPAAKAKEEPKKEAAAAPAGEIIGKPAAGSKFAKLKLGMTLKQVEKLIGPPTSQWQRPTGKAHIPFYFGDDRWVVEYAYSKEGQLSFNYGGEQLLVRIEVNKNQ